MVRRNVSREDERRRANEIARMRQKGLVWNDKFSFIFAHQCTWMQRSIDIDEDSDDAIVVGNNDDNNKDDDDRDDDDNDGYDDDDDDDDNDDHNKYDDDG